MRYRIPKPRVPETPTEVHSLPCLHCPSTHPLDPEALQILESGEGAEFPCSWRPNKLCRGNHDLIVCYRQTSSKGSEAP